MQYIQLQGQLVEELDLPINGNYNLFIDTTDNLIKAQDSEGNLTGGGSSLIEVTKAELTTAINAGTLIPGSFYKITGAGTSDVDNAIQEGGNTIILQAATTSSIHQKGIGLFWNPNYYNPNTDMGEYSVWDNSLKLRTDRSITGAFFDMEETINCDAPSNVVLRPNIIDDFAIVTLTDYTTLSYFSDSANYPIPFNSSNTDISGDFIQAVELPAYAEGNKVIWGGRVWTNLNGNVGSSTSRWNLNPEDWEKISYNTTDYNLVADIIEYDYENDRISYRKDVEHEVEVSSNNWESDGSVNDIREFPWGHPDIYSVSLADSSTVGLVNFDNTNSIDRLYLKSGSRFEANYWGKYNSFRNIYGDIDSDIENLSLGRGIIFNKIRLGINSTIGGAGTLYIVGNDGDTVTNIIMNTDCDLYGMDLYQYARINNITIDMGSDIYNITIYDDSYIQDLDMSMGCSLNSITMGKSSDINNIEFGHDSYLSNLNLDTGSTINTITLERSSFIEYTSLGIDCSLYEIKLGLDASMYCNTLNNQNGSASYINTVSLGDSASINNITLYDNTYIENIKMSPNTGFGQVGLTGSGAHISNFDMDQNSGFGQLSIDATSSAAYLNNFKIGQDAGFGGIDITGPEEDVTIERGFNNFQVNVSVAGATAALGTAVWADKGGFGLLDPSKSFHILDTTDWDASTDSLNYYLPSGGYNGQTIKFFMNSNGSNLEGNAGRLNIWLDSLGTPTNIGAEHIQYPWYPFVKPYPNESETRTDSPTAIWLNGKWIIDNDRWD